MEKWLSIERKKKIPFGDFKIPVLLYSDNEIKYT